MKRTYLDGDRRRDVNVRPTGSGGYEVTVDGNAVTVDIVPLGDGCFRLETKEGARIACVTIEGRRRFVTLEGKDYIFEQASAARRTHAESHSGELRMPMPGLVVRVETQDGAAVTRGQALVVVEAMKMEQTLRAPHDGQVTRLAAEPGKLFDAGALLLEVVPPPPG